MQAKKYGANEYRPARYRQTSSVCTIAWYGRIGASHILYILSPYIGWFNNATLGVAGPIIVDGAKRDRSVLLYCADPVRADWRLELCGQEIWV